MVICKLVDLVRSVKCTLHIEDYSMLHSKKSNLASANASTLKILHRNGVYSIKVGIRKINLSPQCWHVKKG